MGATGRSHSRWSQAQYQLANLAVFCVLAALVILLRSATVEAGGAITLWGLRLPNMCLARLVTGKPCPGCGITRAMALLSHGRLKEARALHPSAPWAGLWLAAQLVARLTLAVVPVRSTSIRITDLVLSLATLMLAMYAPIVCAAFKASVLAF